MNKKLLSIMCLLSMTTISACQEDTNSSTNSSNNNSSSKISSEVVNSNTSSSTSSSSSSSTTSSNYSTSTGGNSGDVIEEEDQYIADKENRVTIQLNVNLPETENEVYVIGDFNNWGKFNTLNDSSYQVIDGSISISNVENDKEYSYMYVQKVAGATYTYNFDSTRVDDEGNQIIGYTSEGKLISQYCISQSEEPFTLVAQEGYSSNDVVASWKDAVYGASIEVFDPNKSTELPTSGYNLCVLEKGSEEPYYIPLEGAGTFNGANQYAAYNLTLQKGDLISLYDGNNNIGWAITAIEESEQASGEFVVDNKGKGIVAYFGGTYDFYVKLQAGNDSIYICYAGEVNDNISTSSFSYSLHITNGEGEERFVNLTADGQDPNGKDQSVGKGVELFAGDVIQIHDNKSGVSWVEKALEPYGEYEKFEVTDNGIVCNASGTYDIYLKTAWEDNSIYIGPAA